MVLCNFLIDFFTHLFFRTLLSISRHTLPVCPATSVLHQCMPGLCLESLCTSDPTAVCRINPCDGCKAEFYDNRNQIVDCTGKTTRECFKPWTSKTIKTSKTSKTIKTSRTQVNVCLHDQ